MLRITLRSLFERKLRLLLSGLAVVLGVAFVSGTFVLTDTMQKVFDTLFSDVYKGTAVTVQGTSALGGGSENDRAPVPQAVLDRVKRVPGVAEAEGVVSADQVQIVKKDGKVYTTHGGPTLGFSFNPNSRQESLKVKQGRAPQGPDEFAVDETTFKKAHLRVGEQVKILPKGTPRTMTLVGVVGLDTAPSLGGASLTLFDPPTAQQVIGTPGTWSQLNLAAASGVSNAELKQRVAAVLPQGYGALTQQQQIDDASKDIKRGLSVFNTVLLAFGFIALFVGMFLIFNTFSMLIAQRTRELALLRAMGASRQQVTLSVLVEAVLVGTVSALIGFVLGIGVAVVLRKLLKALGIELPGGSTVVLPRTFVISMLVGVLVTVAAALIPSRKAARVAPVQAMRESGPAEDRSLGRRTIIGSVLLLGGVAALASGLNGNGGIQTVGLGAALSFLAVATLSPLVARPVVAALGAPFRRLGTPSTLGRANAMRSPRRTAATASALMIGLALVAMVSTFGASVKKSLANYVDRSLGAAFVLLPEGGFDSQFSPVVATRLRQQPAIDEVASYRFVQKVKVDGSNVQMQGVEAGPFVTTLSVKTLTGDITSIDRGELAISKKVADSRNLKVGDKVDVVWSKTGNQPMTIGAVYADNLFAGDYVVGGQVADANLTDPLLGVVAVTLKPDVTAAQGRAAVERVTKAFPNVKVRDQAGLVQDQRKQIDGLLNVVTALLIFSVLIAVLGIINTLALSVLERTRELGLLRAVGLSRRQLRRMIRWESVLISIFGAILGILVGLAFGWALVQALKDQGIDQFALPVARLLLVLVAAALGGVIAAALPARRAARLNVLTAIAEE